MSDLVCSSFKAGQSRINFLVPRQTDQLSDEYIRENNKGFNND